MQTPNESGVYEFEATEELARRDRSYAAVRLCQCDDGLYRYALDMAYSYGGFSGPIFLSSKGHATYNEAKDAGTAELLRRFPKAWSSEPHSVHEELRELKAQIEQRLREPTLF
jgi:transcription initiation factor IIE alpha subunit